MSNLCEPNVVADNCDFITCEGIVTNTEVIDTSGTSVNPPGGDVKEAIQGGDVRGLMDLLRREHQKRTPGADTKPAAEAAASQDPYLLVSPELTNQLILSVRMGISEPDVRRANETLNGQVGSLSLQTTAFTRQFNLFSIDFPRLGCAFIPSWSYCVKDQALINQRPFTYGWKVYLGNRP